MQVSTPPTTPVSHRANLKARRSLVPAAVALFGRANRCCPGRPHAGFSRKPWAGEARYGAVATAHTVSAATGSIANQTDVNSPTRHTTQLITVSDHNARST
jgi:hypothetical protein